MPAEDYLGGAGSMAGMALGGPAGGGVAIGAGLVGGLLKMRSQRARIRKLQKARENALRQLEARQSTLEFGPSQSEGNILRGETQGALSSLASRGILGSNIAAGEVSRAIAPAEAMMQQRRDLGAERLFAARTQVAEGGEMPGYGEAFGGALEQGGELLALMAGQRERRKAWMDDLVAMKALGLSPQAGGSTGGYYPGGSFMPRKRPAYQQSYSGLMGME
ncbi:MAG: hypothetical protein A2V88_14545 [Elusimicrobia bacterium RBG_16_66_12]|nr:MAG: hypothetical protein A2V88_14545 [Elusimicrobia bacterium RBG_16_66_12]